jgi:hypothetical protein
VAVQTHVGLRWRKPGLRDQAKKSSLGLGASQGGDLLAVQHHAHSGDPFAV